MILKELPFTLPYGGPIFFCSQSASFCTYLQHIQQCFCKNIFLFSFGFHEFFFTDLGCIFLGGCSPYHSIPVLDPILVPRVLSYPSIRRGERIWERGCQGDFEILNDPAFYRVKFELCEGMETCTLQLRTSSDRF